MKWLLAVIVLATLPAAPGQKKDEILLSFTGALKAVTKKQIYLEGAPDNQMTFVRSKRTRFLKAGKQLDGEKMAKDTIVTIQAAKKLNGDLEAVIVTVVEVDQPPNK